MIKQIVILTLLQTLTSTAHTASWTYPNLEVRKSFLNEFGLFATAPITCNEILAIFGGSIITKDEVLALEPELRKNVLQIDDNFWMGSNTPEPLDYMNHSCNPNAGIKGQICLVAMRNINQDEEITFDFATVINEWVGMDPIPCNCGAADCRKIIRQDDWKNPKIQEKYKNYFSTYIQNKIDAEKKG